MPDPYRRGVAAQIMRVDSSGQHRPWRLCSACDNPRPRELLDLIRDRFGPVSARRVEQTRPGPGTVLLAYSATPGADPTADPGDRWGHVTDDALRTVIEHAARSYWQHVTRRTTPPAAAS